MASQREVAHFRIVVPEEYRGTIHAAMRARLFVKLPEHPEFEVPGIVSVETGWYVQDPSTITVKMLGSVEVHYE